MNVNLLLLLAQTTAAAAAAPSAAQAGATRTGYELTPGGWLTMILSVGFVSLLLGFCLRRVLFAPAAASKVHAPLDADVDTRDTNDSGG